MNDLPPKRPNQRGIALFEIISALVLLAVGLLALARSADVGMALVETNNEQARAALVAHAVLEDLGSGEVPFRALFAAYTGAAPPGGGAPPAARSVDLDVPGLAPWPLDPDGKVGKILFPTAAGASGPELREDLAQRDLNGDGVIDALDHAQDYVVLPVTVRIRWAGRKGTRSVEFQTLLCER